MLLHGDGQYAPEVLPDLVAPFEHGEADAVFGSRMMDRGAARAGGMPLYKRLGNRILTRFENRCSGTELTEFHSGYRAYDVARARPQLPFEANSDGFDFDTQIIIQLVTARGQIVEVPIPTYYGDEICYVNGLSTPATWSATCCSSSSATKGFGTHDLGPGRRASTTLKEGDGSSHAVMLDMLGTLPPSQVLDIGCSGGLFAERRRAAGPPRDRGGRPRGPRGRGARATASCWPISNGPAGRRSAPVRRGAWPAT